jgi:hypothetical protein
MKFTTTAVKKAEITTPGNAKTRVWTNYFLKICQLILTVDSKINPGKK